MALSNSWVVANAGIGVSSNNGGSASYCTITSNDSGGVQNLGSTGLNWCNLFGNTGFEARDTQVRSGGGPFIKNFENNYWGPTLTAAMTANPYPWDQAGIIDGFDGGDGWFLDFSPHQTSLVANAPSSLAPAFLLDVTPNLANAVNLGSATFSLVFSEAMDTLVTPSVTFGTASPYTEHVVERIGWINTTTWQGSYAFDITTGDGLNTLRVSGARAADGCTIPDDTAHDFNLDTSPGTSISNGQAVAVNDFTLRLTWDPGSGTIDHYEILRSTTGNAGDFQAQDRYVLPADLPYDDAGLQSGTEYFYKVYEHLDNNSSQPHSTVFSGTTTSIAPTPTPIPSPTETPTPGPSGRRAVFRVR